MISVCVCDDNVHICNEMAEIVSEYGKTTDCEIWVQKYYSGEELCKGIKDNVFDIFFLDIELQGMTGIDIGKVIRDEYMNDFSQIVYVSSHTKYAMELFRYRPLNFLVKPVNRYEVAEALDKAIKLTDISKNIFTYHVGTERHREEIKNILYFESVGRKVRIHTVNGTQEFYGTLKDVYSKLELFQFFYIHNSFLVNYQHIKAIRQNDVVMTNNETLHISQRKRKYVDEMIWKFEGDSV